MADMYGDDECICIKTLDESLLSSFSLNQPVTITVSSGNVSRKISGTIEELENTEEYDSYDYSSKKDKKEVKTRPGCIKISVGEQEPEPVDMVSRMEEDDDY